jgi:hypothetical protein
MKANEKKLLLVLVPLAALVLIVRLLPYAFDYYRGQREALAQLEQRIERFETLIAEQNQWMEREAQTQAQMAELESWIFAGGNPNLIGSSVQRALRQAVEQSGVAVRETSVAKYSYAGTWLLVSQDMSFTLEEHQILPFLNALEQSRPRLQVQALSIARGRRQFSGSITVVGFASAG